MPAGRPAGAAAAGWAIALAAWLMIGCSDGPAWREVRPPGWGVAAQLPCKPEKEARALPLNAAEPAAGAASSVRWELWSCSSQGQRFSLGSADVGDPARVGPALRQLRRAAEAAAGSAAPLGPDPAPTGATPQPEAGRFTARGKDPQAGAWVLQSRTFALGSRIVQASVLGPAADASWVEPALAGLRVEPR